MATCFMTLSQIVVVQTEVFGKGSRMPGCAMVTLLEAIRKGFPIEASA